MSDVVPVVREWVGGKEVVVQETRHERGKELHRDMEWGPNVELRESRTYYALVDGLISMQIVGGLGYDGENNLIEVVLFVRKLSAIVPDTWQMPTRDVVSDVMRFLDYDDDDDDDDDDDVDDDDDDDDDDDEDDGDDEDDDDDDDDDDYG
ncbi:hypothetical protein CBR_g8821 [Chara braunii]|uniref:Uncharacterized protein n=1 Tax=Chara braunii TaxID=69332 RepID=A0A388KMY8_CHABU|nr:hypothetical protein CBR_g8821 [Chara braunii]|eukprot:GBG71401.1 hypothetical protein CBR_g8821 [Chara braunii]